jgi:hypothetical protein
MKKPTLSLSLAATLALLGAGCASTADTYQSQSKTAKGAEIGAATGAVLGGIVGHQSNETGAGAAVGAAAGGIAGAAIGHHSEQRDAAAASVGDTAYTVQNVPPAPTSQPYETMPPQPAANTVWIRGHYEYTGNAYQWVPGRWETPPAGMHTWIEPTWQPAANGGYIYTRGHWQ